MDMDDFDFSRPNVWQLLDAIRGVTEALHWQVTRGGAAGNTMDDMTHRSLVGLSYAAHKFTSELQERLQEHSESGEPLPKRKRKDGETVQEGPTIYRIK